MPHTQEPAPQDQPLSYIQDPPPRESDDLRAEASVPWVGIAFAVHVLVLVVAWFVLPSAALVLEPRVLTATAEEVAPPPPPVQIPDKPLELPQDRPETEHETRDEQITPDPLDTVNSDPSDMPLEQLAESDANDPSQSPSPHKAPNSATGLAGGGGGSGGGGGGGFAYRRCPPGTGGKRRLNEVDAALRWLADHQNREGYWSATGFSADSIREGARKTYNRDFVRVGDPQGDKGWEHTVDIGLTGLALLAYTGDGQSHRMGKYKENIRRGLLYLRKVQTNDGCFGPRDDDHFVYNHAIATMAMTELYGLEGDALLRPLVERAVQFIVECQNPGLGWRYGVRPTFNDSSVTGWMVLTLHVAEMAGIRFDRAKAYNDAARWFELVTVDVNGYPRTGYDRPGSPAARLRSAKDYDDVPSMDSIHIMSMLFMDKADLNQAHLRSQAGQIVQEAPQWKLNKLDYYYWYYASLALYQMGGSHWDKWEKPMTQVLLNSQRGLRPEEKHETAATLDEHGSWDPVDAWGSAGGRVYATAINCLTLQVWNRYERYRKS
ncbi:MAG: terpene cyclase/mutase family protein [Planctomycetes bacterium]|nr:terpene cyclase/mutase family protein [Planctomycetota bacterium]MCL4728851.1 terpene cyclase/mutase family protein [Planctomycetota bacterium]